MKKLILFTLMITVLATAKANQAEITIEVPVENTISTDEVKQKSSTVRKELAQIGYSTEMMNDLFGEENFYFPSSREKLNTTLYIVDLLIENGQYDETEKSTLISLAKKAYNVYGRKELAESIAN